MHMKKWIRRALGAAVALTLTAGLLSGCGSAEDPVQDVMGYPGSTVMFTVNGNDVTADMYFYWLSQYADQAAPYFASAEEAGEESGWDMEYSDGTTAGDGVKKTAEMYATLYSEILTHGEEAGYTYGTEDRSSFEEWRTEMISQLGDEEAYLSWLKEVCLTEESAEAILSVTTIEQKMLEGMFRDGQELAPTPEELDSFVEENDILAAKHILLATMDTSTGEALSQEEIDQKKATAEELAAQLQEITDPEELATKFDELMKEYSEDPGSESKPDGYVFTSGDMVEPFEDGTRALEIGQVSGVVESDVGYHIILRLNPVDLEELRTQWAQNELGTMENQWVEEAEIVTTETYDNLDVGDFYDKLTAYRDALNTTDEAVEEETEQVEQSTDAQAEEPQTDDAQSEETQSEETQSDQGQSDAQDTQSQGTAEEAGDGQSDSQA